jgi:hypothetical protein
MKDVGNTALKNQRNKKKREFPTVRFRYAATELLNTHRYVDADEKFYEIVDLYHWHVLLWNEQLRLWESDPDTT